MTLPPATVATLHHAVIERVLADMRDRKAAFEFWPPLPPDYPLDPYQKLLLWHGGRCAICARCGWACWCCWRR